MQEIILVKLVQNSVLGLITIKENIVASSSKFTLTAHFNQADHSINKVKSILLVSIKIRDTCAYKIKSHILV